uniref:Reverse transcriptase domain-containing protein n=1 Tax=Fagus sylvatica TaxID=28930 RepID=A0A2N9G1K5_FAGSY
MVVEPHSDLEDVQLPHNDPLVITLRIGNYDVQRVLIDQGSFAKVMYQDLYKKLGLGEAELASFTTPIFGFLGEPTVPLGKTVLPVLAGPINLQTEFIVVKASSPYNAIMGRDWLHRMRAIPSTLHQKLRFPTKEGIMELNRDQELEDGRSCNDRTARKGATYQIMVTKIFGHIIGKTVEVYIDDMLIKSLREEDHVADLLQVFDILRRNRLRLNASKCTFGVSYGKFLGHMNISLGQQSRDRILAEFLAEFQYDLSNPSLLMPAETQLELIMERWELFVDRALNSKGSRAGIVLVSPEGLVLEQAVRLKFSASNNEAEYKALMIGEYQARGERMSAYLTVARSLQAEFESIHVAQIGREHNSHADILAKLATALESDIQRTVCIETLDRPSFQSQEVSVCSISNQPSWMDPILSYLKDNKLLEDKKEANMIKRKDLKYWVSKDRMTVRKFTGETLFALSYGVEAVIPLEVGMPTIQTTDFIVETNEDNLRKDLDLLEERRDLVVVRLASYQQRIRREHDKNVKPKVFQVGDLVLRKVMANTRKLKRRKTRTELGRTLQSNISGRGWFP